MRVFTGIVVVLAVALSGCASPPDRSAILNDLNPAPVSAREWQRMTGSFTGPIRAARDRSGYEALTAIEIRLDLSGWADSPAAVVRMSRGYTTAWTEYGEWVGNFTNVPSQVYGSQGDVVASTHAPNQLLLILHRRNAASKAGAWMILSFRPDGESVDVDWVGRSGWRGTGELTRTPVSYNPGAL
jgi:hypothetical protein